jgi:hypothetical protein
MERNDQPTLDILAIAARLAAGKDASAQAFFGQLPEAFRDELFIGWRVYEERKTVRAQAGVPLPPGGCFVLGDRAVIGGLLAEIHNELAKTLKVGPERVKLMPSGEGIGVEAYLPQDWIPPGGRLPSGPVRRAIELFVQAAAEEADVQYRKLLPLRLAAAHFVRRSLIPEIEGW